MDAHNGYAEVKQWDDFNTDLANFSPLALGQKGSFKIADFAGVEFTVIGIMVYRTVSEFGRWLEYQLFSSTHGYYFLVYEEGHWSFVRKVREMPSKFYPITKAQFSASGRQYTVFETYQAELIQIVGETTWEANIGDRSKNTLAICPPYSFEIEKSETETEYFQGHYLSRQEVEDAFGPLKSRSPDGVHPSQPYLVKPTLAAISSAAKPFAIISLLAFIALLMFGRGEQLYKERVVPGALSATDRVGDFTVVNAEKMLQMSLDSSVSNSWAWYHLEIVDADSGTVVYDLSKELSYYYGGSGDDSWSEGNDGATLYFKAPKPGRYTISLADSEGSASVLVEIRQGVLPKFYFVMLMLIFAVLAILNWMHRRRFESKRWDVLEDDE